MTDSTTTRRRFLVAAFAFAGLTAGTVGPAALRFGAAWAQSGNADTSDTLIRLARLLLPYDDLADNVYAEVSGDALAAIAEDTTTIARLLDAQQSDDFLGLDEDAQLAVMRAVENEELYVAILGALKTRMYDHPKVWEVIKYEGPSYQNGGYLNRGAGDIDWLPEGE